MTIATLPALFISHGAPSLALATDGAALALKRIAHNLPKPRAIVVMSAHWESDVLEVSTHQRPETWHDFRGFEPQLYQLRYPAAGDVDLAHQVMDLLKAGGLEAHPNTMRPRDHGVWVPLMHLYPDADIPVIQISVPYPFKPSQIYYIGQCLAPLRHDQILLIGSGSITHNLGRLSWSAHADQPPKWMHEFCQWMIGRLAHDDTEQILAWQQLAPYAKDNHPTDEHLKPLFFAYGAGSRFSIVHQSVTFGALAMDIYRFD